VESTVAFPIAIVLYLISRSQSIGMVWPLCIRFAGSGFAFESGNSRGGMPPNGRFSLPGNGAGAGPEMDETARFSRICGGFYSGSVQWVASQSFGCLGCIRFGPRQPVVWPLAHVRFDPAQLRWRPSHSFTGLPAGVTVPPDVHPRGTHPNEEAVRASTDLPLLSAL
jgi:hypothetical protein